MAEKKSVKPKKSAVAKAHAKAIKERGSSHVGGFISFVREQGVVGLAVGLAIGTAAGSAVKSIVDGLINPIVGFIIGGVDLSKLKWVVIAPSSQGEGGLVFSWGTVLSAIITLLATAFVVYLFVHFAKLDRVDKKKE
jgi:large conductance mechanosensitive channel